MKKKKILIIALAQSTHTHAWIDLISRDNFDVRVFGLKNSKPGVPINTFYYCLQENFPFINQKPSKFHWLNRLRRYLFYIDYFNNFFIENWWLARIIKSWKPDIIHTLGIDPAALRFLSLANKVNRKKFKWIVTIRGGSDLELERFNPEKKKILRKIFRKCDYAIADNKITYEYAYGLGLARQKKPRWDFVPGTGGMNIEKLSKLRKIKAVKSRIILWPKACEATYSKGLPVLEAIKLVWRDIKPCQIIMTAVDDNFKKWLASLPKEIQKNIKIYNRIPRTNLLKIMANSRVVLLPSLIDGIPNSLYEAIACQAIPIVSPLDTIKTVFDKQNVLFARNLYPIEIAAALKKAMSDDEFVDKIIVSNLLLVGRIADRKKISREVNIFYSSLY